MDDRRHRSPAGTEYFQPTFPFLLQQQQQQQRNRRRLPRIYPVNCSRHQMAAGNGHIGSYNWPVDYIDWSVPSHDTVCPSVSTIPTVQLLKEANQRVRLVEQSLIYMKVLGSGHLLLGLSLATLHWVKLVLLWTHLNHLTERKLSLLVGLFYPFYIILVGLLIMAVGVVNRKIATQLLIVSMIALLTPFFVVTDRTPFVTSVLEAVQIVRAKDAIFYARERPANRFEHSSTTPSTQLIRSSLENHFMRFLETETFRDGMTDVTRVSTITLTVLQHLLIIFSSLAIFHCFISIVTLIVAWRLLNVQ